MGIVLLIAMLVTVTLSIRLHGLFSFVALGAIGAAIYTVPGIIDTELPFGASAYGKAFIYATPAAADAIVLLAWVIYFVGVIVLRPADRYIFVAASEGERQAMTALALATASVATIGLAYLAYDGGFLFFLASRDEQSNSLVTLLWRWSAPLGLVAATLARSRGLFALHAGVLFIIFLRGDRTMVAMAIAALLVAIAHLEGNWRAVLAPHRLIAVGFAALVVFFGKSTYVALKSGLTGGGWVSSSLPLEDQLVGQFEPLTTYSHLSYVLQTHITIPFADFLTSILASLLLFPSLFGLNTNIYNVVVTATLPPAVRFGVAGNYIAHGYTVGGIIGVCVFYLLLVGALRLCDHQFVERRGALKLFWAITGGILAFYVHRNGMDNLLSFVRQAAIVCIVVWLLSIPLATITPAGIGLSRSRDGAD